jgi:hypothetical protein
LFKKAIAFLWAIAFLLVVEKEIIKKAKTKRPGYHAYDKHPVLLLPSGPDKVWALTSHESESMNIIT